MVDIPRRQLDDAEPTNPLLATAFRSTERFNISPRENNFLFAIRMIPSICWRIIQMAQNGIVELQFRV